MKNFVLKMIKFYQDHFSPDHSPLRVNHPHGYCKYYPTCSQYGYEAVEKYGVWRGGLKAAWRILRCNPLSKGGYDPVK